MKKVIMMATVAAGLAMASASHAQVLGGSGGLTGGLLAGGRLPAGRLAGARRLGLVTEVGRRLDAGPHRRQAERAALARAVAWHAERRIIVTGRRTVVFS